MNERALVQSILIEFGSRPGLRIWRHNVGAARSKAGALVRFGQPGQADIMGIRAPHGQLVAIECKSPTGRQTEDQRKWQRMIEAHGGLYVLARNLEDVRRSLSGNASA